MGKKKSEVKKMIISVRMNEQEHAKVLKDADALSITDYMRRLLGLSTSKKG